MNKYFDFETYVFKYENEKYRLKEFYEKVDDLIIEEQDFGLPNKDGITLPYYINNIFDTEDCDFYHICILDCLFKRKLLNPEPEQFFHLLQMKYASNLVHVYLSNGVDININDALYYSCVKYKNFDTSEKLLMSGANVNYRYSDGKRILDYLDDDKDSEFVKLLRLYDAGRNDEPDAKIYIPVDHVNSEYIRKLVWNDRVDILEILIKRGLDINDYSFSDDILCDMIDRNSINMFKFLANKSAFYVDYDSPEKLYEALYYFENIDFIKAFVEIGYDKNLVTNLELLDNNFGKKLDEYIKNIE